MNIPDIATGTSGKAARIVDPSNLASTLGSGTVDVLGTPAMIALMEQAAVAALADLLTEELTSVGIYLEIRHLAATPPGMEVQATATVKEVDGRVVTFDVSASDSVETIGSGLHRRMIVDLAKFQQRASEKANAQS